MEETTKRYHEKRREYLHELITEYMDDEDYSARRIYEEILSTISEEVVERQKPHNKAIEVRELLMGYRVSDAFPPQFEV